MRHPAEFCSECGGEKDANGWCANYCMDDNNNGVTVTDGIGGQEE